VPGAAGGQIEYVDMTTDPRPSAAAKIGADQVTLGGYSVAVLTFP